MQRLDAGRVAELLGESEQGNPVMDFTWCGFTSGCAKKTRARLVPNQITGCSYSNRSR